MSKKLAELTEEGLKQVSGGGKMADSETPFSVKDQPNLFENQIYPFETEESARKKFFGN